MLKNLVQCLHCNHLMLRLKNNRKMGGCRNLFGVLHNRHDKPIYFHSLTGGSGASCPCAKWRKSRRRTITMRGWRKYWVMDASSTSLFSLSSASSVSLEPGTSCSSSSPSEMGSIDAPCHLKWKTGELGRTSFRKHQHMLN